MRKETITRVTVLFSFLLSLLSSTVAFLTGGDLFFIVIERFVLVFAVSAALTWITLSVINSVIIGAARSSIIDLNKELNSKSINESVPLQAEAFEKAKESISKGLNLDLTSEPQEELSQELEDLEKPEINEFEPFKPRRIETDIEDSSN